ncbi:MAG: 3-deoxy-D-manno-octulosonic acid transferase [Alphaproteobacteria bacterium]|nr:3-deoxy-D-manno-octulosonic acid transferase [Alphaproteobacteria bacterium]
MVLILYRWLTWAATPLVRIGLCLRRWRGLEDVARFRERLGYPSAARPSGKVIWCHAASVGEAVSLLRLIVRMHDAAPAATFVLTTGTVTAAQTVRSRLPPYALHQYVPVDLAASVRRFLDHWRPELAVWIESELWPNTLAALRARNIPCILLNARMSERSFRHWSFVKGFVRQMLSGFCLCLAQTEADRARFAALGATSAKCVGNLKYAAAPLPCDAALLDVLKTQTKGRPVWLMASSHPGEEALALRLHEQVSHEKKNLLTIIAPRHPSRGDDIVALIEKTNLSYARRSKNKPIKAETDVYLADTMGEMGLFYALSPVTVVGGSFAGTGGHNPIEPAQLGSVVLFGPSMENFSEIAAEFLHAGAAMAFEDEVSLAKALGRLFSDDTERAALAKAARLLAERKGSIMDAILAEIAPWLKDKIS